ncbi:MAG: hypothetical protein AAF127_15270 [Pseudomonadota bacterium]
MNTPAIDITAIPGLDTAQGLFGSIKQSGVAYDDSVVAIMVYIHDTAPPALLV